MNTRTSKSIAYRKHVVMMNEFVDEAMKGLHHSDALVWFALYRDRNVNCGESKSAQSYISKRTGLSLRQVKSSLKRLIEIGMVEVIKQGSNRTGISVYEIFGSASVPHGTATEGN